MAMSRKQICLAVIVVPPALVFTFVMGLFVYVTATMTPLHPDPKGVPSVTPSAPLPKWANAVEQGRQLVRATVVEHNLPVDVRDGDKVRTVPAGLSVLRMGADG